VKDDTFKRGIQGCLVMVGLVMAAVGSMLLYHWLFGDKRPYNPAVFQAFRRIEHQCIAQDWERLTVRCDQVIKRMEQCDRTESGCTADEYYDFIAKLGFDLPPLRLSDEQ
jgi:hypothetical protein